MYPSDLTDKEWELLAPFFQRSDPRGNPGKFAKRDIVNAILYVTKGGIQWRMMPKDFPPWDTVYDHFRRLGFGRRSDGTQHPASDSPPVVKSN
jgi:putative transposase